MNHKKTRKMIYLALLSAIAIVLHTVEAMIPVPLPVGAKLGLANIISLVVVHLYGVKEMFIVNIFRVFVSSLLTGIFMQNPFFISCGGVFLSSLALAIIYKFIQLPMVSTSIVSAITPEEWLKKHIARFTYQLKKYKTGKRFGGN